ncbi:MAG: hypothetical protein JRN21_09850 [Nitrososphaerota archaeon]|nr:hypothetical protein [Nitrososphaerota archaeon]
MILACVRKKMPRSRVGSDIMPAMAASLPTMLPAESVTPLKSIGEKFALKRGNSKGQKYLMAVMQVVSGYALAEFSRMAKEDPAGAEQMAKSLTVPFVVPVEGRKEYMVRRAPLKEVIESLNARDANNIGNLFTQKYAYRFSSYPEKTHKG